MRNLVEAETQKIDGGTIWTHAVTIHTIPAQCHSYDYHQNVYLPDVAHLCLDVPDYPITTTTTSTSTSNNHPNNKYFKTKNKKKMFCTKRLCLVVVVPKIGVPQEVLAHCHRYL
jgi:hypothetical protein